MEDLAVAVREMRAAMKESFDEVKGAILDNQAILRDVVAWRPQVDGAMSELRNDINVLRWQLGEVALNLILAVDLAMLPASSVSMPVPHGEGPLNLYGDIGRETGGHDVHHLQRRVPDGCRCSGYRGIPVHLLLGPFNGPTSARGGTTTKAQRRRPS
jgi:hypothetical protein